MEQDSTLSTTDQWVRHIEDLLALLKEFEDMAIMAPDTPHDREAAKVVAFKFVHAVRTLKAIVVLSQAGDSTNATILARAMLENFIDAIFLMRNPQEVWRYLEEAADLELKIEASRRKYNPNNDGYDFGKRPSSLELRQQFQALGDQRSTIKSWRRLNLRTRAERAEHPNILALYELIYPVASAYTHGSSTILMEYLRGPIDHETGFHSYEPADAEVEVALNWAASNFSRISRMRGHLDEHWPPRQAGASQPARVGVDVDYAGQDVCASNASPVGGSVTAAQQIVGPELSPASFSANVFGTNDRLADRR